jgi:hypothetical protein
VSDLTSKEVLITIFGEEQMQHFEMIKVGSMRVSKMLTTCLVRKVEGRVGGQHDPYDALTDLGNWEFCLDRKTKNASGRRADEERAPGRCVQIFGNPHRGWMNPAEFLQMHGVRQDAFLECLDELWERFVLYPQLSLLAPHPAAAQPEPA